MKVSVGIALGEREELIQVEEEDLISFPRGIIGFEEFGRYALFSLEQGLYLLQTVSDPHVGFVLLDPTALDPDYPLAFPEEEKEPLGLGKDEQPVLLCITTLSQEGAPETVNLRAPIAINPAIRVGTQVVLQDSGYPTRGLISRFAGRGGGSEPLGRCTSPSPSPASVPDAGVDQC